LAIGLGLVAAGVCQARIGEIGATGPAAGTVSDVKVSGTFAYLAAGEAGLAIADVSNPRAPSIIRYVDTPGSAVAVDVLGAYAYVADRTGGVAIIDISTPTVAYKVKSFGVGLSSGGQPYSVWDVAALSVDGHTRLGIAAGALFVAADVSLPAAPALLYTNVLSGANSVRALCAWDGRIWAACEQDGLRGYDMGGVQPALAYSLPVSGWGAGADGAVGLAIDPALSRVYVTRGGGGLTIGSLADPSLFQALSTQPLWGWTEQVAFRGTNVYVVSGVPGETYQSLYCFNASDPQKPETWWIYESRLEGESEGGFAGLDVSAPWLYAAAREAGLAVFPLGASVAMTNGFANLFSPLKMWTGGQAIWQAQTDEVFTAQSALGSGTLTNQAHTSWVETRVKGPGVLQYQWKQTGDGPAFRVTIDGVADSIYTSSLGWRFNALALEEGWHLVRWMLTPGFSPNLWVTALLDNVIWTPGNGRTNLAAAADGAGLLWTTGGYSNWMGQLAVTHDGVDALQSGILSANQTNWVETAVDGPGALSFWWKVSSDDTTYFDNFAKNPEDMGDQGQFLVDGVPLLSVMGEKNWSLERFMLPPGSHILRWQFGRDGLSSIGADALWLDQVSYTQGHFPAIALSGLLEFGDVAVGGKKTKKLGVVNSGTGPLNVKAIRCPAGFSATPQAFTVQPGHTQKVAVAFSPTALGVVRGTLTVKSDARAGIDTKELIGEGNGPGTIRMAAAAVQVLEGYTQEIRVRRVAGDMGGASVTYATADGTAKAGKDYTAASGTLWWFYGDSDEQIIEVPIRKDAAADSNETFRVILGAPTGGARLGSPSQTTVTIRY
jgi:hypothetical protein